MLLRTYSVLLHIFLSVFSLKFFTCLALGADACKSVTTSTSDDCELAWDEEFCDFPFPNLCRDGASITEVPVVNKYESGNVVMKQCDPDDIDFKKIKDYALGVHGNDGYSKFQELYPFECEDFDDTIASGIGVVLLKSGYPDVAIDHYTKLIEDRGYISCVALYFGRAMAFSKLGIFDGKNADKVVADYTNALLVVQADKATKIYEARAKIHADLGLHAKAYEDYSAAIKIEPKAKYFLFRGVSLVFMEQFSSAYFDLQESLRLDPHQSSAMHFLATCLYHMRRMDEAIKMFEAVLLLNPQDTEIMLSLAQAYTEVGDFDSAIDYYNKASILKSADASILQKKAYLLYEYGKTAEALTGFRGCVSLEPFNRACRVMVAQCFVSLGQFYPAIKELTKATLGIGVQNKHGFFEYPSTMYLREWCRYIHLHLDMNVGDFDVEKDLHQGFKENWTRDGAFFLQNYTEQPGLQPNINDLSPIPWNGQSRKMQKLLCFAFNLGKSIHMQGGHYSDSSLGNVKAFVASGLSSIEISQTMSSLWSVLKHNRNKAMSWRNPFEIAVKWMRLVDLGTPVFWMDPLSPSMKTYSRRFSLIQFNLTRLRYSKYYSKFYHVFTQQCDGWTVPPYDETLGPQENFYQMLKAEEDFGSGKNYIHAVHTLRSRKDKSKMEGYSLILQAERDLKKISLSLELAMTWIRVERFHEEMDYIWQKIVEEYKKFSAKTPSANSHEPIVNLIVSLSYYFLNLLPLSRSSTVVSHSTAVGLIFALGRESTGKLPAGKDLALEALTSSDHEKFRNILRSWISFKKMSNTVNTLDNVSQTFPTYRSMLSAMQYDFSSLCKVA